MKFKKTILALAVILLGLGSMNAQETIITAGSDVNGSSGKISYSVGQIFYTEDSGIAGSVLKGIQQSYEIYSTLGNEEFNIDLKMVVFPNPTSDLLSLSVADTEFAGMSYQLNDVNGRQLENSALASSTTSIHLEHYPSAMYFLQVMQRQKIIKIFKIIKK